MGKLLRRKIFHYPEGAPLLSVHPGRTLAGELVARGMTANALALRLRVPAKRVTDIVRERRGITAGMALRLGRCFGTSAQFWMNLQANYDLAVASQEFGAVIEREVEAG